MMDCRGSMQYKKGTIPLNSARAPSSMTVGKNDDCQLGGDGAADGPRNTAPVLQRRYLCIARTTFQLPLSLYGIRDSLLAAGPMRI